MVASVIRSSYSIHDLRLFNIYKTPNGSLWTLRSMDLPAPLALVRPTHQTSQPTNQPDPTLSLRPLHESRNPPLLLPSALGLPARASAPN
eukprot:1484781-Prymnesium_polylepis.1